MHLEDRLLRVFLLGVLVCIIALPVGLIRPQAVGTLFFVGMMGMVLVSPA